jgi:plasmid stability protein
MAILNIRKLPDDVHARLRLRAAHNRRSMEAEARDILERACAHHYTAAEGSSSVREGPNSPDSPDSIEGDSITLTPGQLIDARAYATRHHIMLKDVVPCLLALQDTTDDDWAKNLFARMDEVGFNSGGVTWTRDELYRV